MNIHPLESCCSRQRECHSEKGQQQFPSGLSTKTGSKLSFQLHLSGPFRRGRVVPGSTKPEQPNTARTTKTWTACDTHLSSRSQPRLLTLPTGNSGSTNPGGSENAHLIQPQRNLRFSERAFSGTEILRMFYTNTQLLFKETLFLNQTSIWGLSFTSPTSAASSELTEDSGFRQLAAALTQTLFPTALEGSEAREHLSKKPLSETS